MDDQAFDLLMLELKDLKKGQGELRELMEEHNKLDMTVHKIVDRHSTYFSIISPFALASVAVVVAWVKEKLHL